MQLCARYVLLVASSTLALVFARYKIATEAETALCPVKLEYQAL